MAAEQRTQRRERHQTETRDKRLYVTFSPTELAVVKTAAGREQMAPAAWAGRQLIAVAQHTLIPLSADTGDVLRELIRSRVHLQETVTALRTLTAPTVPFPVAFTAPADRPCAALPNAPARVLPDELRTVLDEVLSAVRRVDEATVQVMRERRPRS